MKQEGYKGTTRVKPENVISFEDELLDFADGDKELVAKWLKGIEADTQDFFTYCFPISHKVQQHLSHLCESKRETHKS